VEVTDVARCNALIEVGETTCLVGFDGVATEQLDEVDGVATEPLDEVGEQASYRSDCCEGLRKHHRFHHHLKESGTHN
jgi:hypothetical protein